MIAHLFERRTPFSVLLHETHASLASCALVALAFSFWVTLLVEVVGQFAFGNPAIIDPVYLLLAIFSFEMILATKVVCENGWLAAIVSVVFSFLSLFALPILTWGATAICASPMLVIFLFFLLRDRIDDYMRSSRSRESFRRSLELATLNPADASAHYNLGLLYQQRGNAADAKRSFLTAVEIDPTETDAHYQLGRIACEEGNWAEALGHFEQVIAQAPAYSHHEVWREIGRVYYSAQQYQDALPIFDRFVAERPSDAEEIGRAHV